MQANITAITATVHDVGVCMCAQACVFVHERVRVCDTCMHKCQYVYSCMCVFVNT